MLKNLGYMKYTPNRENRYQEEDEEDESEGDLK